MWPFCIGGVQFFPPPVLANLYCHISPFLFTNSGPCPGQAWPWLLLLAPIVCVVCVVCAVL